MYLKNTSSNVQDQGQGYKLISVIMALTILLNQKPQQIIKSKEAKQNKMKRKEKKQSLKKKINKNCICRKIIDLVYVRKALFISKWKFRIS